MVKQFLRDNPIHKRIVPYFDYFFLLRPTLYFAIWVMVVLGMSTAKMNIVEYPLWIMNYDVSTLLVFLGITLLCSGTFIINQITDKESDAKNQKLFLIGKYIEIKKAQQFSNVISIMGMLLLVLGNLILVPLGVTIYILWGITYNKSPFEWKKHPYLGILTNIVIGIILFLIGWLQVSGINGIEISNLISLMTPYILCFTAVSLMTNIPDIKGDASESANTFSVKFGRRTTTIIATLIVIVAFYLSYKNSDPIASTASLSSIPFFVFALFRNLDKDILRAIRYPIFLLNFFVFAVYPWLFVSVFIIYYISKYYYWHRFDLHYPTFLVEND
ncbi:MAG: UbiA family prenyltransferase [Candidatus Marinimicrobia bacterium]|jgi:4-hydroxybenzoate polyprenyltransferase|nr:UbiA family prenyltransferase [Candidatus Neomarinimicrobiota bacterium]|tara:strand:+ start:4592 stop:5581 length:990 start_codon:yes stop_codon:yes gene_type:complete